MFLESSLFPDNFCFLLRNMISEKIFLPELVELMQNQEVIVEKKIILYS